jgi:hypothetical protein
VFRFLPFPGDLKKFKYRSYFRSIGATPPGWCRPTLRKLTTGEYSNVYFAAINLTADLHQIDRSQSASGRLVIAARKYWESGGRRLTSPTGSSAAVGFLSESDPAFPAFLQLTSIAY